MAKTYTAVGTVAAGDVYTAASYNAGVAVNVSNLIVPPSAAAQRTTALTGYLSDADITWQSALYDTDVMWAAGSPTRLTINTTGLYLVSFSGIASGAATITEINTTVKLNGTNFVYNYGAVRTNALRFAVSFLASLTAADYLTATVTFTGGSAYSIGGATSPGLDNTRLAVSWIGRLV